MTIEELKEEARKLGYDVVPKREYERLLPCTCGHNRRERYYCNSASGTYVKLVCARCGRRVEGKTESEAKRNWNKTMRGEVSEDD